MGILKCSSILKYVRYLEELFLSRLQIESVVPRNSQFPPCKVTGNSEWEGSL